MILTDKPTIRTTGGKSNKKVPSYIQVQLHISTYLYIRPCVSFFDDIHRTLFGLCLWSPATFKLINFKSQRLSAIVTKSSRNVKFVKKQGLIYISCMNLSYHYSRNFRIRTPTVIVVGTLACGMFAFSTNIYFTKKNVKNLYQYFIQKIILVTLF